MTPDEAHDILQRYRSSPAYPVAGKPFGWGIVQLKTRIEQRLRARGMDGMRAYMRTQRIYERIMRYKPSYGDYCEAQRTLRPVAAVSGPFNREQLEHIVSLWSDANDPMSREIAAVASNLLLIRS
jgi:hypothetical protein